MSDETERALILARLEGYVKAWLRIYFNDSTENAEASAKDAFPLPSRKEPRVWADAGSVEWRVIASRLEIRSVVTGWKWCWYNGEGARIHQPVIDAERAKWIADLFASPFVEVPDDG